MINKKNELGKHPDDIGAKDAIHVAIVAVRAACLIRPGQRCGLNEFNEAVPNEKGVGVADPFLRKPATTGESFWLLLAQDAVPNVRHVWEHEQIAFAPPTREAQRNKTLVRYAALLGVTFEQLMAAGWHVVNHNDTAGPYPGTLDEAELSKVLDNDFDKYDFWSEWSDESGHEFENSGTSCCPEYDYPDSLFA